MDLHFVIHLSREWESILSHQSRSSSKRLAEDVGNCVLQVITANPTKFSMPIAFQSTHIRAYYTPSPEAEPWEWWDQVWIKMTFESPGLKANEFLAVLKGYLPENTHLRSLEQT